MRSWVFLFSAYDKRIIGYELCQDCHSNMHRNNNSRSNDYDCTEEVIVIIVIVTGTLSEKASIEMGAC